MRIIEPTIRRIETIQERNRALIDRAAVALIDMLDAIGDAQAAGASKEQLAPILALQRQAQWRLDFISSENSGGFHADQEAARILAESMDLSRQAQARAVELRATAAPERESKPTSVEGVTPDDRAPIGTNR